MKLTRSILSVGMSSALLLAGLAGVPAVAGSGPGSAPVEPPAAGAAAPVSSPGRVPKPMGTPAPRVNPDGELPSLRTGQSRTFQGAKLAGGRQLSGLGFTTRLYAGPVNFLDGAGVWQKIDTTLRPSAAGFTDATSGPAALSAGRQLTDGVTVGGLGGVRFVLAGAAPVAGQAAGDRVRYPAAFPGVDVVETAVPAGVRELFVLDGPSRQSSFITQVSLPAGAVLAPRAGGAVVTGPAGGQLGIIPAPVVSDSAGAVSSAAAHLSVAGDAVTVSVDPGWLADRSRRFPVSLDPDYYSYGASATLISGAKADTNISGPGSNVCAGWDNPASSSPERGVVKFPDVGTTVKPDAEIVQSVVGAHVTSVAGAADVAVYPLTRPVDPATATWNQAAAGVRWTAPGGDFNAAEGDNPQTISAPDGSNVFHHWNMNPDIAQGWLRHGGQTGFLFKAGNEAVSSQVCMTGSTDANYGPFLDLTWQFRTGIRPDQKYLDLPVDDHESVHVNLTNLNLVVTAKEFGASAPGVPLGIFRTWNLSQAGQVWQNGYGWFQAPGESGEFSFGPNPSAFLQRDGTSFKDPGGAGGAPWQPWHLKDYTYHGSLPYSVDRPPPGVHATSGFVNSSDRTVTDNGTGTVDTFTTASNGQDAKITDRNGNIETIGHSGVFTPNNDTYPTAVQDTAGRPWTFNHTTPGTGFYTSITAPPVGGNTPTASYTYSGGPAFTGVAGDGQLLTATDATGGVTTYAYDSSQRITKITSPAGRQITIGYTGDAYGTAEVGRVTLVTDPATGAGHSYYFDGSGFTTTAGGGTETDTVTDPDGNKTLYTYNPDDQIIKTTDALGHARSVSYGPDANVTTAVDAMGNGNTPGNTSTNSYDADNRGTGSTAPTGAQTSVRYAEAPGPVTNRAAHYQPSGGTDPNGSASSLTYDGPGNLKSSSTAAPGGAVARTFTYNPPAGGTMICGGKPGQLCTSTDGNSHTTSSSYDSAGNLITRTPPAPLPASSFSYDALGRVATATDGKGQLTRYGYDLLNRLTMVQFSGTSSCTSSDMSAGRCLTYSYDSDGNRLSQLDQTGTTSYGYDQLGREVTRNLPGRSTMSLSYDNAGNVETVTDAAGTIVYGYDIDNQLISLAEPGGSCTASPTVACTSFGYNNNGLRTSTSYPTSPNRTVISLTPDNSGRPADIKTVNGSTVLADFSYAYSYGAGPVKDGALATRRVDVPNSLTTSYGYDTLNRLTAATEKNGGGATTASWNYGYDNAGNRTGATINGAANTFGFNNANELTSRNGSSSGFSYDPNGNETGAVGAATRTAETWNDHNQLTSATAGGSSTPFSYTGLGQDLRTNAGATSIRNTQVGITGLTIGSSTTNLVRDPAGTLIATHTSGASSYYLYDGQGSVIGLVDATGRKINSYSYDPYGNNRAKTETVANPFQYTAGYLDSNTGLYKLGARYYDPTLGRFTQQDPSGQEVNLYAYAGNNPINNVDPSGRFVECGYITCTAYFTETETLALVAAAGILVQGYFSGQVALAASLLGPVALALAVAVFDAIVILGGYAFLHLPQCLKVRFGAYFELGSYSC